MLRKGCRLTNRAGSYKYKFTVVYCESVSWIRCIIVNYLLIIHGIIVALVIVREIVHVILFLHASVHMAR